MKSIIILAIFLVFVTSIPVDQNYFQNIINQVNSDTESTWKAGVNERFIGMSLNDIRHMMGVKETPDWVKLPEKEDVPITNLPDNFDSREKWPTCESMKDIRDQSNCGSCWAFGAASAMSDRICAKTGKNIQISSEDILSCCGIFCGQGCNGGYPAGAWRFFKNQGVVTGFLYGDKKWCKPYTLKPCSHHSPGPYDPCTGSSPTPKCKKECIPDYGKSYTEDKNQSTSVYSMSNAQKIQQDMFDYGPVEAAFTVYEDFLTYKSGVYQHKTGAQLGGHAIKCLGWGIEDGIPYWLCANSWNEYWGDKGFFKILRGKNHCGIEGGVVAGNV